MLQGLMEGRLAHLFEGMLPKRTSGGSENNPSNILSPVPFYGLEYGAMFAIDWENRLPLTVGFFLHQLPGHHHWFFVGKGDASTCSNRCQGRNQTGPPDDRRNDKIAFRMTCHFNNPLGTIQNLNG